MEFSQKQIVKTIAVMLLLAAVTQAVYTVLYMAANDVPRKWLWGFEALIFVFLAAFAGAAMVQAKEYALGFSAIFASALLNVVQVGIGLTQFGPFYEAVGQVEGLAPAAGSVVALSFFIYNAAKILLGFAAFLFGAVVSKSGANVMGKLTMLVGVVAVVANAIVMMFGRMEVVPSGATGVIATVLLAVCLLKVKSED